MREATLSRLNKIQEARNGNPPLRWTVPPREPLTLAEANGIARKLGLPPVVHAGHGIYVCVAEITPQMCAKWLNGHNSKNRNEILSHARVIASDMGNGDFHLTHQGLAFDETSEMIDGQNRCSASVLSNSAFTSMVFIYVARAACRGLDSVKPRSWKDGRLMDGRPVHPDFQSVLKVLSTGDGSGSKCPSSTQLDRLAELYDEAISFALEHMRSTANGVRRAAVWGAIARAWFHCDKALLERFCEVLTTCRASDANPAEDTIIALHRVLVHYAGKGGGVTNGIVFAKTLSAISGYMSGKQNSRIYDPPAGLYPLPKLE